MRVIFEKPKGLRIKSGTHKGSFGRYRNFVWAEIDGYWWADEAKKWMLLDDFYGNNINGGCSTGCNEVKNVKQLVRHMKKHSYIPKGTKIRLASRFIGFDVYGIF